MSTITSQVASTINTRNSIELAYGMQ